MPRKTYIRRNFGCGLAVLSLLAAWDSLVVAQAVIWTNPQTGPTAGVWSNSVNWNPATVPGPLNIAQINNGGEARITSSVSTSRIEVGKNGGTGILTSTIAGTSISTGADFDTGEIGGGFATGPGMFTSVSTSTITDAASIILGTSGAGDLDVGQASATLGATASATGVLTIERVPLVQVTDDVDLGQAGGTATAIADGSIIANNIGTFDVGAFLNVGVAGDSGGNRDATGTFDASFINLLMVKDDFFVGGAFSAGNQGVSLANSNIADAGTIDVGGNLHVGLSTAKGGGTAESTATLNIQRATALQVGTQFNIGRITSELQLPLGTVISGQANTLATSATLTDVADVSIGTGMFVGRAFTGDNAKGSANGTLTIDTATSVTVGADLDIGQTGSTGTATDVGVSTSGTGNVTIRNVTGTVGIGGDIDVGTTGSVANTATQGNGTLLVENVGTLNVTTDLDVGQVSGAGQSTGVGMATIRTTPIIVVGDDIDVGFSSGSASNTNVGNGTLVVSDATVSIGFANPLFPGSLHLGNVSAALGTRAQGQGIATFERSSLAVADSITVGKLSGGSADSINSSQGTLNLIDSSVATPLLDVATVFDATAGTVSGTVHLDSSLVTVAGAMTLGSNSLLEFGLAGTTKADGSGAAGQFSAIDADMVTLDGDLNVFLVDEFVPSLGDTFPIISGPRTGTLNPVAFPVLPGGLAWAIQYNPNSVILQVLAPLNADFDNDGDVDVDDLTDWESSFGAGAGADADGDGDSDGRDFLAWQQQLGSGAPPLASSQSVPEPTTQLLYLLAITIFAGRGIRSDWCHWRVSQWEGY